MNKIDITKTNLIDVRPGVNADRAFIISTWLKGLRFGNAWYGLIESATYYQVYHLVIETLLDKPETKIDVACLKDDPEVILGFAVHDKQRLHWVHVKRAWRKIGIAKRVVPKNTKTVSHLTEVGRVLMLKHDLKFNPFLII